MLHRAKTSIRHLTDRLLSPYFAQQSEEIEALGRSIAPSAATPKVGASPSDTALLTDFNLMLHTLRSVELARMPHADDVLLSVGCSDRSYFDWIERCHGEVPHHWGVELYRPRPDDLPDNVAWYVSSASHMPDIADGAVDVVFSGQNIEHLPVADLVGFLTETRRVLRPGGHLVIDSPNRLVTSPTAWRHPEHVVEFSPTEASALLELAGFDVVSCRGLWLGADPSGNPLPLLPDADDLDEFLRRSVLAATSPDRSFCWWVEACRTERPVDVDALIDHVTHLVGGLWPERVNRGAFRHRPDARGPLVPAGTDGLLYRAGPIPVFVGSARASVVGDNLAGLHVHLVDDAGTVLAEGIDAASIITGETIFGVWVEVRTPSPLSTDIGLVGVEVTADHLTMPAT